MVKYWNHNFVIYSKKKLQEFNISEKTKDFLEINGLPYGEKFKEICSFRFLNEDFLKLVTINEDNYLKIAEFILSEKGIFIKEKSDEVYFIDLENEKNRIDYCNNDIIEFIIFKTILSKTIMNYDNVHNDELQGYEYAREIVEKFKEINNKTLYKFSYWSNMLLQFAIDYFYEEDEIFQKVLKEKNMIHMKMHYTRLYFLEQKNYSYFQLILSIKIIGW